MGKKGDDDKREKSRSSNGRLSPTPTMSREKKRKQSGENMPKKMEAEKLGSSSENETSSYTVEQVGTIGLQVLEHIKMYRDRQKRLLAAPFQTLPSRKDHPKYYKLIKQPIDLRSIEEKSREASYTTIEELSADLLLVFSNAKEYNDELSQIYRDAQVLEDFTLDCLKNSRAEMSSKRKRPESHMDIESLTSLLDEIHARLLGLTDRQ
jgi:protein polybromo-1